MIKKILTLLLLLVTEQPPELPFNYFVAFATLSLQPGTINYPDMSPLVINQPAAAQLSGSFGYTLTTYTEHVGKGFMGKNEII